MPARKIVPKTLPSPDPLDETFPSPVPAPPRRRRWWRAVFVLLLLATVGFAGFCLFLDAYGQVDQAKPAPVIVVLGARVLANHQPGDSLRARTLHAVQLYRSGFAPRILFTGGLGAYAPTEAEVAAQLALREGVPPGAILQENESTSTTENVRNTAVICRKHGWTRVIVVSDPYHLWRAQRCFTRVGLLSYPSPAKACLRNRKPLLSMEWTAREAVLVLRDLVLKR
ncbi:MAG TPA: YdcF family protein [Armatimonadota bacterium]